jgi:plasmid segregation protein ParM
VDIYGVDIGFGFTKATSGSEDLLFKSVIGEATDMQYRGRLIGDEQDPQHLHLEIDGHGYFIGDLADRQSSLRSFTLDQNEFVSRFARPLALAALGQLAGGDVQAKVVVGLPIKYYQEQKGKLASLLRGEHPIARVDREGTRTDAVIDIEEVRVIPQPFGTLYDLMLNEYGEPGDRRFLDEKVGVIDVGFRTVDYTISDRTRFNERGSRTSDLGISRAFSTIAAKLQEKTGINIEIYRLFDAVGKGVIKVRGKRIGIETITEKVMRQLAADIAGEVERLWADDWDIDTVVITGGGGAVLGSYLQPLIGGEVLPSRPGADPRMQNVTGYWKYGKHRWDRNG